MELNDNDDAFWESIGQSIETIAKVLNGQKQLDISEVFSQISHIDNQFSQLPSLSDCCDERDPILKAIAYKPAPKELLDADDEEVYTDVEHLVTSKNKEILLGESLRAKNEDATLEQLQRFPMIRFIFDKIPDNYLEYNDLLPSRHTSTFERFLNTPLAVELASECLFPLVGTIEELEKFQLVTFYGVHDLIGTGSSTVENNSNWNWLINPTGMLNSKTDDLKAAMSSQLPSSVACCGSMHFPDSEPNQKDFIPDGYELFEIRRAFKISRKPFNGQDGAFVAHQKGLWEIIRLIPKNKHHLHHRVYFVALLKCDSQGRLELELTLYNKDFVYWHEVSLVCEVITFFRQLAANVGAWFKVQGDFNTNGLAHFKGNDDGDGETCCRYLQKGLNNQQVHTAKLIRMAVFGLKQILKASRVDPLLCLYVDENLDNVLTITQQNPEEFLTKPHVLGHRPTGYYQNYTN